MVRSGVSRGPVGSAIGCGWILAFVIAALAITGSAAARPSSPAVLVTGPTRVNVGQPFVLTLRARGVAHVAAFQSALFFDEQAAHLSDVQKPTTAGLATDALVDNLGPLEVHNGYLFGSYTCAAANCAAAGRAPKGASGDVALAQISLRADKPGTLALRFANTELVDVHGRPVKTERPTLVVTIHVRGVGGRVHLAPAAPAAPSHSRRVSAAVAHDATGDGALTEADVTEAALKWNVARMDGAVCGDKNVSAQLDANGDGCLDIADVQAFATAVSAQTVRRLQHEGSLSMMTANAPLVVNSTGDTDDATPGNGVCATTSGSCTLRAAIDEANAHPGADTINFAIPGSGVQTIQLGSDLPTISDTTGSTTIDGYTQPGATVNTDQLADNAQIKIQIRGTGPSGVNGLMITSADNVLRGLAFYNLKRIIYMFHPGATGNSIVGDFVGTDATGTFAHTSSDTYASGIAIESGANHNNVGNTTLADRNVISGNARHGIVTYNEGSNSNVVYNNIIGLSPLGDRRLGNLKHGIDINAGSSFNVIGGTGPLQRNVISGNGLPNDPDGPAGVEISHATTTTGNRIIGNFFGTDLTGAAAPSYADNGLWGVHIEDGSNHSVVSDNVIVNSLGGGVKIQDVGTVDNQIENNRIGLTTTGVSSPNQYGIQIANSATNNIIGPGNIIANNPNAAVWITGDATDGNTVTQNSMFNNSGLGIDLDPFFQVNANDPGDVDTGSNQQLNYPLIGSASPSSVTGTACAGCTVEVFIADSNGPGTAGGPGAGAYGEGKTYLGSATADSSGNFSLAVTGVSAGQWVTTTATDSGGNTSEFSQNVQVSTGPATLPGAPNLTSAVAGNGDITLSWTAPSNNGGSSISGYKIYRGTSTGGESLLTSVDNGTSYDDASVSPGTTYYYEVAAVNAVGTGPVSNERFATFQGTSVIVKDTFQRTVSAGFGTADIGGTWTVTQTARTKVTGTQGVIYGWTGGNQDTSASIPVTRADTDTLAEVTLSATDPSGAGYQPRVVARAQTDPRNGYVARLVHQTSGAVNYGLSRVDNAGGTGSIVLAYGTLLSSGGAGTSWWIRLDVQGTSVKAKFWRDGTQEPSTWTATATDSYWTTGTPAVGTYVGGGLTSPFPSIGFDNITVTDLGGSASTTVPTAPSLTSATGSTGSVALQWSAPSNDGGSAITGYNVYRATSSGNETLLASVANQTSYTDTSVTNGTTYFYTVAAVNSVGTGAQSNELSATPGAASSAPGAPSLTSASGSSGSVSLQWSVPASDGGSAITGYNVYRATSSGNETLLASVGNQTSYTDATVTNGTTYFYTVAAVNSVATGPQSNELSATPQSSGGGSSTLVSDAFGRTVSSGWGAADTGGTWNVSALSRTSVSNGRGVISGWTGGNQDVQASLPLAKNDTDSLVQVTLSGSNPTGGNYQPRLVARSQNDPRNGYVARIVHTTSGAVTWGLSRVDNAGGANTISLGTGSLLSSGGAGTSWWIRLDVQGTSVKAKFWRDGTTEPSAWTVSATDSYWAAGGVSLGTYAGSGLTSPFPSIGFDNLTVTDLTGVPAATAPGAPSLASATGSSGNVSLQWSAPSSDGGSAITGYKVYRATSSGNETLLASVGNQTSYTDTSVTDGTTYFYKVAAVNSVGTGAQSNELSATPQSGGGGSSSTLVSDAFGRTVSAGWGAADTGGTWSVNSTARTSVSGSQGVVSGWTGGNQDVQASLPLAKNDTDSLVEVTLSGSNPTGGNYQPRLVARAQSDARNGYVARIVHTTSGAVTWGLSRVDNAGGANTISLGTGSLLSSGGAGTSWWIRLDVQGTSIEAKFWRDGTTEPSAWTVSATDSYWASGGVGLGVYAGSGLAAPFPSIGFDNLTVTDLAP
jgi:CSLREA domain-containing protein